MKSALFVDFDNIPVCAALTRQNRGEEMDALCREHDVPFFVWRRSSRYYLSKGVGRGVLSADGSSRGILIDADGYITYVGRADDVFKDAGGAGDGQGHWRQPPWRRWPADCWRRTRHLPRTCRRVCDAWRSRHHRRCFSPSGRATRNCWPGWCTPRRGRPASPAIRGWRAESPGA
ncbi:MAG: hypothetical protein ABTS16_23415 [Candidatus Accumulibacter phosphatis]|uniref:hypothetical protein n=1 Tax=Candidatus Accumulibacter contiguus TaxID=2954381 RepID=UPI00145DA5B1|nr:hypothetical protein [Candidatus Accumulibacter contiguus]